MSGRPLRVLEIYGDSIDFGRTHGKECADLIGTYLADRLGLSVGGTWSGRATDPDLVLTLADATLPFHRAYSLSIYEEMEALAEAAGITPAQAVVVGGFTDLVDVVRARVGDVPTEDDCTAVLNPANKVLAQTWDMHASALDYVVFLKLDPVMGPALVVQTTAGCLGQIGMNEAGIAIGINNLTAYGKPGVTWPFVVRKVLQQTRLDQAIEAVLDANLAGGHNFLVMGPDGEGANIEAMPGSTRVTMVSREPFVHTNHCLDDETRHEESERAADLVASSQTRLERGRDLAFDLEGFFAEPSIARRAPEPHAVATCGAVAMYTAERRMETVWGVPGDGPWETFQL